MTYFQIKNVIAYFGLFATFVFNTLAVVFLNSKLNQNNIQCKVPEDAILQETFYNDVLKEIMPLIIGFHIVGMLIALSIGIIAAFINYKIYTYHLICVSLFCSPLLLVVPIMTMAVNHSLYHAVTELGNTYNCQINFFFAHKIILPFSINGIFAGTFTICYFIFYLLLYNNRFCFDTLYTPTLLLNMGALEKIEEGDTEVYNRSNELFDEIQADIRDAESDI